MANIITATEFAAFRNISSKIDTKKIDEAIQQAEDSDLNDILGGFFFDVQKNKDDATYTDLMNGSEFTYCDETFIHKGIKVMLADYAYARYVYTKNVNDTAHGFVAKNYQDGITTDRNVLKDLAKQAQIDAGIKFRTIEKYILSEPTLFSRYCDSKKGNTGFNYQRFSKL